MNVKLMKLLSYTLIGCAAAMTVIKPLSASEPYVFFGETTLYDSPFADAKDPPYTWLSTQQSLELTANFYQLSHLGIQRIISASSPVNADGRRTDDYKLLKVGINVIFDLIVGNPLIWLHEEHHRSVLSRRGIDSRNESYFFYSDSKSGITKVSHVSDEELAAFKQDHPAEFIYMHTAGIAALTLFNRYVENRLFFHQTESYEYGILWLSAINNYLYMSSCASGKADSKISKSDEINESDKDFTGFDCRAWTYDLHRPGEAYSARGERENGAGNDRYIDYDDLTDEEKDYLKTHVDLFLLNFIDPHLFGFHRFNVSDVAFNLAMRHFMAPFGSMSALDYTLDFNQDVMLNGSLYLAQNKSHSGFGLEVGLYRYRLGDVKVSPKLLIAQQPRDQSFYSSMTEVYGGQLNVSYPVFSYVETFARVSTKSAGWIPGEVYLTPVTTGAVGLNVVF